MSRSFEFWYPWLFAVVAIALSKWLEIDLPKEVRIDLLSASISLGSIFAGFLITVKSIFMALPADSIKLKLKQSGYLNDLGNYIAQAIWASLLFCLFNLAGFFLPNSNDDLFVLLWFGLVTLAFFTLYRVTKIMLIIFKIV